jgi:Ca2+-binding RTX toxin-like protein
MIGGAGNDIYFVDSIKDQVIEASGGGTDTVNSSINYKLDPYVEYLILLGSSNLTGEGNGLNNKITGNSGANTLSGLDGDDILDGGAGADTLIGGKGDDTFVIDNAGDQIVEMSGGGIDTVKTALSNYALGDHVENLIMTGMGGQAKGNTLGNHMIGDKGDNIIDGKGGDDVIEGGWGNDIIIGGGGNDILTGNQNADVFRFGMGSGKDVITDFGQGYYDSLDFSGWISNGYRPVMSVDGNDVVFSNGAGDSVRLLGVHATSLATTATGYTDK